MSQSFASSAQTDASAARSLSVRSKAAVMFRAISSLAAVGATAVLVAGCLPTTPNAAPQAAPPPPKITVAAPLKRVVPHDEEFVGRFIAVDSVEIKARVSGYLDAVHFKDGQMVEKGQLLFTIDRRPFEITLEQARATLGQAEAALELANNDLARARDLSLGSTITRQTFDQRVSAKRSAEALVPAQSAVVRQATLDLEFTVLKAPISGRIGDRQISAGNFVSSATTAGSTLLATIQSIDPIRLEFTFDEAAYLRYVRSRGLSGDSAPLAVTLKLLDEKSFAHEGRMHFIDNAMNRSSGTIRARAEFANPGGLFAPGMFARIRVPIAPPSEALLIPDSAVGSEQVRKYVLVADANGTTSRKFIELGPLYDGLRVVTSGLEPSDQVVLDGLMRVRPGMKIDPQPGVVKSAMAAVPTGIIGRTE